MPIKNFLKDKTSEVPSSREIYKTYMKIIKEANETPKRKTAEILNLNEITSEDLSEGELNIKNQYKWLIDINYKESIKQYWENLIKKIDADKDEYIQLKIFLENQKMELKKINNVMDKAKNAQKIDYYDEIDSEINELDHELPLGRKTSLMLRAQEMDRHINSINSMENANRANLRELQICVLALKDKIQETQKEDKEFRSENLKSNWMLSALKFNISQKTNVLLLKERLKILEKLLAKTITKAFEIRKMIVDANKIKSDYESIKLDIDQYRMSSCINKTRDYANEPVLKKDEK